MDGVERIAAERKRQIEEEGWTATHDTRQAGGEMAAAAAIYALQAVDYLDEAELVELTGEIWPWEAKWWKPGDRSLSEHVDRSLEKAGALIAAELDRRQRRRERRKRDRDRRRK